MVRLTQSLQQWLFDNHREKLSLIMFGHVELLTEEMYEEYLAWVQTDEGRKYLKGGSKYNNNEYNRRIEADLDGINQGVSL